jgi:hypothetical protein
MKNANPIQAGEIRGPVQTIGRTTRRRGPGLGSCTIRGCGQITTERCNVLVEFSEHHVGSVHAQLEWLGRKDPGRADFVLVTQNELAGLQWTPSPIGFLHAIARIPRHVRAIDRRLRDWIGQFYASLESGHTTASVALQRLVSCTAKNHFYRANRDLGRIFKIEFLLSYLSEPRLRVRIRRGLLKVEQLHALARDIYYGRRGRINARELHEQMNSCSCLTLLLACVVYWQAKEISRVLKMGIPEGEDINISLLERVSPIEWENVILYGQYVRGRSLLDLIGSLQELSTLGVGFVSLCEALDLTTPSGRALAAMLAVFAEFERKILRDRVKAGIAQALASEQTRREGRVPPT